MPGQILLLFGEVNEASEELMSKWLKVRVLLGGGSRKNEMRCVRFFGGVWGR